MRRTRRESPLDVAKKYIQQNVDRPILRRQYINDYIGMKMCLSVKDVNAGDQICIV